LTDSSEVDIDHAVPLADAWRSGASSAAWSTVDREAYANDPEALLSTDAGTNRTKGDKGPEAWRPPNHSVNPAEKSALQQMLATCRAG
jgi:hypothetical protein